MDTTSTGSGGGGGGPAPFLLKTYDMIDDSSTDEIVSWSSNKNSFVVWNPPEFARHLLPTYFKHNNFSSFIRQLNTYGFRKIDPERWEFSNEDFMKDQKHLLKNIHRRKPIHSHSNSHSHPQGSSMDPERAAFEEEIDRLSHDRAALEANILRVKKLRSAAKLQLEDMTQRVESMELRQENVLTFLEKVAQNPTFVEHLAQKIESMDITAYNKKRRLPQVDHLKPVESSLLENNSCSRSESGNVFHQDFSNKLRLELSPAVSDIHLVSYSTQSSNEDAESPHRKITEGDREDAHTGTEGNLFVPETFELADTGTSFAFKMDSYFPRKVSANESTGVCSLQQRFTCNEEVDGHVSCQLNLTLASSPLQIDKGRYPSTMPQPSHEIGKSPETRYNSGYKESDTTRCFPNTRNLGSEDNTVSSSQEAPNNNPGPAAAPARVNDVFWEHFLTERPGCSDNEEASSSYRANPYEEQEDRRPSHEISRNAKNMEQLTL